MHICDRARTFSPSLVCIHLFKKPWADSLFGIVFQQLDDKSDDHLRFMSNAPIRLTSSIYFFRSLYKILIAFNYYYTTLLLTTLICFSLVYWHLNERILFKTVRILLIG